MAEATALPGTPSPGPRSDLIGRLLASRRVVLGSGVLALFVLAAVFAPLFAPHDPVEQDLMLQYVPPFWDEKAEPGYPLGTDNLGRDILSRLIHGARVALFVAVTAAAAAGLLGTVLGLLAGYVGGWVDTVISRLVDIWMAFPAVLLSIVLVAVMGTGLHSVIIAIAVIDWTRFCRVVRAETMMQKQQDYVASAVTIGLGRLRILRWEILPNVLPLLVVLFTLEIASAVTIGLGRLRILREEILHRGDRRGHPELCEPLAGIRFPDLGQHDRRRPEIREPGALADDPADPVRHRDRAGAERPG